MKLLTMANLLPMPARIEPMVDGVCGSWLDDDGLVLPQYREIVARLKQQHRRAMEPLSDTAMRAVARSRG